MSEPYLSEIRIFPYNFAPRGWAYCNGQLLAISQNAALFSLLGTTYGGNGVNNFALPNLQNRVAIHAGQGPGLSSYVLGQAGGEAAHTLISTELPQHAHPLGASSAAGNTPKPAGAVLSSADVKMYTPIGNLTVLAGTSIGSVGGNQPHSNTQPYLGLGFCIAIQGLFPSRN